MSLTQAPATAKRREVLERMFRDGDVVKRKWSQSNQVSTYRALKITDDVFVAIEREPAFVNWESLSEDDRAEAAADDKYTGPEFHVLNAKGEWAGPSLTVYGPEVEGWGEPRIKQPEINASSGRCDVDSAQGAAVMFLWAKEYADAWVEDATPRLEQELADTIKQRDEYREESRRNAEDLKRRKQQLIDGITGSKSIRLTLNERKTPLVGTFDGLNDKGFVLVSVSYRDEPVRVSFSTITKAEANFSGQYTEVPIA